MSNLNEAQLQAVNSDSPQILCLAGAGTGKTRVLTERVARLIAQHRISPLSILCLTFTRKAAGEMRDRLSSMLTEEAVRKLRIGTFHSFCYEIVKAWGELAGYRKNISIYDEIDQLDILWTIIEDFGFKITVNKVLKLLDDKRRSEQEKIKQKDLDKAAIVFLEYRSRIKRYNALDYQILVDTALELLQYPQVLEFYRNRFKHILIDEYQDIDPYQYDIHQAIQPETLFVVGDNDQSIYGWRKADIRIILDFMDKFPEAEKVVLEENYRSRPGIIEYCNKVIALNKNRFDKKLIPTREPSGEQEVQTKQLDSLLREGSTIVEQIKRQLAGGKYRYDDIAILARTNRQLIELEQWLQTTDIPCVRIGAREDFWKREEIRLCAQVLKLIHNPWDNQSLKAILKTLNIDVPELKLLEWRATKRGRPLVDELELLDPEIERLLDALKASKKIKENPDQPETLAADVLVEFVNKFYLLDFYLERGLITRRDNIRQVSQYLLDKRWTLEEFVEWFAYREITDELEEAEKKDEVRLMTVHMAKGLEFPVVFVMGLIDGVFPSRRGDPEEERRLFYVACTRAQDRLFLSCSSNDGHGGIGISSSLLETERQSCMDVV